MRYASTGRIRDQLSVLGLGGHEFLADGRSRGFNEDFQRAVRPGELFDGFGTDKRRAVLDAALGAGINFLDATIDSEKEALGRNLRERPAPHPVFIQTRPEGMGYNYDLHNVKMARYELLRDEVRRILDLLKRPTVDFLNLPFMASALQHDADYLDKIAANIHRLKDEGLIRHACADTFSGEATYLRQIRKGCFDALFINFNLADDGALREVFPAAAEAGMGLFCRETFIKGQLFRAGDEAGLTDRSVIARAALKWVLSQRGVTVVVVGVDNPEQLANSLRVLDEPALDSTDQEVIGKLNVTETFRRVQSGKRTSFFGNE